VGDGEVGGRRKLMCRWKDEWVVVGWVDLYVDGLVNR
jgi:hypothetical protein